MIRGDHPAAANLAWVWLELRKTLNTLASVTGDNPQGEAAQAATAGPGRGDAAAEPGAESG